MQRLSDSYYTGQMLDGVPSDVGVKPAPVSFIQGEDIYLSFYLNYLGQQINLDKQSLEVFVKKLPQADNVLWDAKIHSGLFHKGDSLFYILMPADVSARFIPGTYYLEVKLTEKIGEGVLPTKDMSVVILSTTLTIELGASSPNPKLRTGATTETAFDPISNIRTYTVTSVERTLPNIIDTSRP